MVEASPLIEVYKDVRNQFEKMFCLSHKTTRHSPPNMKLTFQKLARFMEKNKANEFIAGRDSVYEVVDSMEQGMDKLTATIDSTREKLIAQREQQDSLKAEAQQMQKASRGNEDTDTDESEQEISNEESQEQQREHERNEMISDLEVADDGSLFVDDLE